MTAFASDARCHAGAEHGNPQDRGAFGWLCDPCWEAVRTIIDRLARRGSWGAASP